MKLKEAMCFHGIFPRFLSQSVYYVTLILLMISFVAPQMGSSQNLLILLAQHSRCCLLPHCSWSLSRMQRNIAPVPLHLPSVSPTRHPSLNVTHIYEGILSLVVHLPRNISFAAVCCTRFYPGSLMLKMSADENLEK